MFTLSANKSWESQGDGGPDECVLRHRTQALRD